MDKFLLFRSYLTSIDDCLELKTPNLNLVRTREYCHSTKDKFFKYHRNDVQDNRRFALPITNETGEHDDSSFIGLRGSGLHEMSFTKKTQHYYASGLDKYLDIFGEDLGRTHIINTKSGGIFAPHRDGPLIDYPLEETFRLLLCIDHCDKHEMHFTLENSKVLPLHTGKAYFINTMKLHSQVSFHDNCFFLVANIRISENSISLLDSLTVK